MSGFMKYSRWLAATILFAWGLRELFAAGSEPGVAYRVVGALFFVVPAVGVVLLINRWARPVAIAVCAFNAAQAIHGPFGPASLFGKLAMVLTLLAVLIWLILPKVRHQFLGTDANA
jgi:uncharacterized membrane protein